MSFGEPDGHNVGDMLDGIASVFQNVIKIRRNERTDLKNRGSAQTLVFLFTERNFFAPGKGGGAKLLHTVGSVGIKIGKTENPSVIKLHFVGRPGIQRHILDLFDGCFHKNASFLLNSFENELFMIVCRFIREHLHYYTINCENMQYKRIIMNKNAVKGITREAREEAFP